jgi:glucan phosphoethanolaminetransferase (alkaline phosphatase superfamily)
MFSENRSIILLRIAAVLVGLSGPLIVLGRSTIGITLGVALILVIIGSNHRENWDVVKQYLHHWMVLLVGLTFIALSFNLPFSIRPNLSFEAWIRSYALLAAVKGDSLRNARQSERA